MTHILRLTHHCNSITEKSTKLKLYTLNQHAGWTTNSNMAQRYLHYFGNESSQNLLEAYGIVTNDNVPINTLNPKICVNCNESNTQDANFCSKCKMIMSLEGYQEALDSQRQKEDEMQEMKDKYEHDIKAIREEMNQQFSKMMLMMQQNPQLAYIKPEALKGKIKA